MKDAVATMGTILPEDAGGRDAVHVAVISAVAGQRLLPSQDVGFVGEHGNGENIAATVAEPLGIVDPFLKSVVEKSQRFWVYLYPRTITGLRHHWTHPKFADAPSGQVYATPGQKLASVQWIDEFARGFGFTGARMIEAAREWIATGDYWCEGGTFEGESIPDVFWEHYERATGEIVPNDKRHTFFTCSC